MRENNKLGGIRWPSSLTFPVVILLILAGFYWKLVFTYQYDWLWGPDLSEQVYPWLEEEARQAQHGQFPLWDPHNWMGQSLLGQAQPGVAYPLNWLLWLIPRSHGHIQMWALQWYYVTIHFMAALFCYWLCRDLKRSRAASLIAGLIFSLVGYVGWVDWPQMVNGAVWTPLVFLFLLRAARGVRPWASAVLCGTSIGMAWLSGHHQVPIFLTLAAAGTWIYYIFQDGRLNWLMARLAAVSMIFAPVVGALQILPAQEYGKLAWRWVGAADHVGWQDTVPYYVHAQFAQHPLLFLGVLIPGFFNNGAFLGVVAISLALLGIALWWRQHAVKLFGAVALGAIVYSLGGNSVFNGFLYAVIPFVEKARVPAMATVILSVACAALAAFGVDGVSQYRDTAEPERSPWLRWINIGIASFAGLLVASILVVLLSKQQHWDSDDRIGMTTLCAILMAALVYAWRSGNLGSRQAISLLAMLFLLEAGNQASFMLADRNDWGRRNFVEKSRGNQDIVDFLHSQPGTFRVETDTPDITGNWGDFNGIDFVKSQAGVTVNIFEMEWHQPQTQKLLGVKFVLNTTPTQPDQKPVFQAASNIIVYENPAPFPRVWTVHEAIQVHSPGEVRAFIVDHVDELRNKVLMAGNLPQLACPGATDQVHITKYEASRVSINVLMACQGMLILSDSYYAGWEARVDGRPVPIHEVDIALRGVVVPAGPHEIVFRYRPRSFALGLALTLSGWLMAAAITILSRKKARLVADHE